MSKGRPVKVRLVNGRIVKTVRLEPTDKMIDFCEAQSNFSESIHLLILEYITRHNGSVGDVVREYDAGYEDYLMQIMRQKEGMASNPPRMEESRRVVSEEPKEEEPPTPRPVPHPPAPPDIHEEYMASRPSAVSHPSFDDADDDDDEIPECYR